MITKITKCYIHYYADNNTHRQWVEWIDQKGKRGVTSGDPDNAHMQALRARAQREGLSVRCSQF
jgi:hypothetical protein